MSGKRLLTGCLAICFAIFPAGAQTTRKIQEMERQRKELSRQIEESETLLRSMKKDVGSQLDNLALLSGQIDERKKYVDAIGRDVDTIQSEVDRVGLELHNLQVQLAQRRGNYEKAVKYMHRNKSIQEKLMFILSADNLMQMYRRLRYVRQYADYQRTQGMRVEQKQREVEEKKKVLLATRLAKQELLRQGSVEKARLEAQEKERKQLLASLQSKQQGIRKELEKKRRAAGKLNAEIDRLVEIEIENARKRAEEARRKAEAARRQKEEEARRRQAEEARRKQEQASRLAAAGKKQSDQLAKSATSKPTPAAPAARAEASASKRPAEKMETYRTESDDRQLAGSFERNKGMFPVPVTGAYLVVGHYGQYQVDGLRNVRLDNKGVDIKAKAGAYARSVFDGEVSAVFQYNGLTNVLVRHGSYISVYCNLSSVRVKKGSRIRTRDVIGQVNTDSDNNTILHFQLRRETTKLNPEAWIRF